MGQEHGWELKEVWNVAQGMWRLELGLDGGPTLDRVAEQYQGPAEVG